MFRQFLPYVSDRLSKAEIFNYFLLSQCNIDTSSLPNLYIPNLPENINVNEKDVLDCLRSLGVSKATRPDGIGPTIL